MNDRELMERVAAEVERASAAGDHLRAQKLAALQRKLVLQLMRDIAAEPPGGPMYGLAAGRTLAATEGES